jgi:PIN domain nuclease of toxin-antitoxin system
LIDNCWQDGGTIFVSSVTAWEIALLVDVGRIALDVSVDLWIARLLEQPGIAPAPLVHRAAARCYQFDGLEYRDPADRLLIATAIELNCPLVTYDARIAGFAARQGQNYGFAIAA